MAPKTQIMLGKVSQLPRTMQCMCGHETEPGTMPQTFKRATGVFQVLDLPARVCPNCGAIIVPDRAIQVALRVIKTMESQHL